MIDSHAHYNDKQFNEDRDALLLSLPSKGIEKVVNVSDCIESMSDCISLAEKYDHVYATVGVHPYDAEFLSDDDIGKIKAAALSCKKVVAIGEIGLDYHYNDISKEGQQAGYIKQIALARELNMPIVIHERDACRDNLEILKSENVRDMKAVMHCFSGSVETLKIILNMGLYISLGGVVTFKNAAKTLEVAKYVPLDRLMLETDAPYLAPTPYRGKRNDSTLMHLTAEKIAELRGISFEEVAMATTENARRFFGI